MLLEDFDSSAGYALLAVKTCALGIKKLDLGSLRAGGAIWPSGADSLASPRVLGFSTHVVDGF